MKAYHLASGVGIDGLKRVEIARSPLAPKDVRVRIEAAALNRRDIMLAEGRYTVPIGDVVVPLCDGAGVVIETGSSAARFKVGDRVVASFWPDWIDGMIVPAVVKRSLGAQLAGTLAEELVIDEKALAYVPSRLSSAEAAAIPCAGVTAWNALFVAGCAKPGATVLLLGTGGVSIWALQLAAAAGLRTILLSSSDDKLERAVALGASAIVNYRKTPEWQDEVLNLTDGLGVDLVVEVGGRGTMARSISATRMGGTIVSIGFLSGDTQGIDPGALVGGTKTVRGIMVGSRAMLEDLVDFIEKHDIRPAVETMFAFDDADLAFRQMFLGRHFGKIVISVP